MMVNKPLVFEPLKFCCINDKYYKLKLKVNINTPCFSCHFTKGNTFCDFLYLPWMKYHSEMGCALKENNLHREKQITSIG